MRQLAKFAKPECPQARVGIGPGGGGCKCGRLTNAGPGPGSPRRATVSNVPSRRGLFPSFTPTVAFVRDYLRFADQYVETPHLWSPDSDAIVFGATSVGLDTTAVARLDGMGGVRNLGVADVSFWSPLPLDATSAGAG